MYERKNKTEYIVYNNKTNFDTSTWKKYDDDMKPVLNSHENFEIKLPIYDAALRGTQSHKDLMQEITSRI
jgi:hypothetical protein